MDLASLAGGAGAATHVPLDCTIQFVDQHAASQALKVSPFRPCLPDPLYPCHHVRCDR